MLVVVGRMVDPRATWVLLVPVLWGSVLALHAAYAMGLFDVFREKGR